MVTPPLRGLLREGRHLHWGLPRGGRVAVPGCGRGHDLRAWSAAGFRVTGFDLVPDVVAEARALLEWNRASGEVLCRDVLGLAQEFEGEFDLVYDYGCFCALPRYVRKSYGDELAAVLRPGGMFLLLAFPFAGDAEDARTKQPVSLGDLGEAFGERFALLEEFDAVESAPDRVGRERWFLWRRR